ncbi:MAG: plasmid stabilization protein [Candidatus Eisenbacteria bacterium]|nr:plasmid stabilization protein [Candidatus Eisenbacteria bacterium]
MKKTYEVLWAAAAELDLLRIAEYIAQDDPRTALKILNKIKTRTARLEHSPKRGRIVPELLKHGISRYREVVIRPWRVLYRIEDTKVYIVSVIDGRRNVEDVLLERLVR